MASEFKRGDRKGGAKAQPWSFKYRDFTGRYCYGTGWTDKKKTLDHARNLEAEHAAIARGEKPIPSKRVNLSRPYDEVVSAYLAWGNAQGGRGGRPWSDRHALCRKGHLAWWKAQLALEAVGDIDGDKVETVVHDLLRGGECAPKTVATRLEAIRAMCLWAVRRGILPVNPLATLDPINTTPQMPHRALDDKEVAALLSVAPPKRRLAYQTALETGFRAGELRALTVASIDPFGPSLVLDAAHTKNRKAARQPITRHLLVLLEAEAMNKPDNAPLLSMPSAHTTAHNIARDFSKAKVATETKAGKATFHSLRKTYINAVVRSGADLRTCMTLARHSSAAMTMEVYASDDPALLRAGATAAAEHVKKAVSGQVCSGFVPLVVNGGTLENANQGGVGTYGAKKMATPTGFEPVSPP